jgi:pentatricopeptide repeat protein
MIKGYSKTGQYSRCKELFEKIKSETSLELNLVSYNCIIDVCVRAHDMDSALRYFEELKKSFEPDLITYSTLIKGYCFNKQIEDAIQALNEMLSKSVTPDEPIFNLIMDSSADLQHYKLGLSVHEIMKKSGVPPNQVTFGTLVKLYGFANMVEEAFALLDSMKSIQVHPSLIVYTNLMHIAFRCDRPDLAEKSFQLMSKQGVKGDHICFSKLITGF